MVEEDIERPFPAYDGDEKYIFVSYAHEDGSIVFPEIKRFHDEGFHIWYDEGVATAREWLDVIENAILNCSLFVVFLSDDAVESKNVRNETFLALAEEIPVLPIFLEETELKHGLRLSLVKSQLIFKYRMSDEEYVQRVTKAFKEHGIN